MHTSPLRHCELLAHVRPLQQGYTQRLLPATVLIQKHTFLVPVPVHLLSQLLIAGPLLGHVGTAWAAFADPSSPAAPNSDAPANLRARRREMFSLANALARSSKERCTPVLFTRKALIHLPYSSLDIRKPSLFPLQPKRSIPFQCNYYVTY
jgi:hypothetical protein